MKKCIFLLIFFPLILFSFHVIAQISVFKNKKKKHIKTTSSVMVDSTLNKSTGALKAMSTIKPYKDVITKDAITTKGLFIVHQVDRHYYFEIPDSMFGRELLSVTRFSKVAGGVDVYPGQDVSEQTIKFEKGPYQNIFLRMIAVINVADSTSNIYQAVENGNENPIVAAFDIKAYGNDSNSFVIDVTDLFNSDNPVMGLPNSIKQTLNLSAQIPDRSYIKWMHNFPLNTEVRTVKTYTSIPPPTLFLTKSPSITFPVAYMANAVTVELNNSLVLLPSVPMIKRQLDPRVGYFGDSYQYYDDKQQSVDNQSFIVRWRIQPKAEDIEKYKQGILVEPEKPIVFYIDPATPSQWVPYLIKGVNQWQKAFEQAGFKNAIMAKEWPKNDSTMSLEDSRYSALMYFSSDIKNAYGPNIHDPRSGEIIESHIRWYHNVLKLLHDWYMIQAGAVDTSARHMIFSDSLMGKLVEFVVCHEVGHTLGLQHNMGSSSTVPVDLLRNKAWVEANGHTPSIMDYARFNYVAQPEDHISEKGLFPRLGVYDKWAIQWGYTYTGNSDMKKDHEQFSQLIIDSLSHNHFLWFGSELAVLDPRCQTEDLGDDNMLADHYGILNLKRILLQLPQWTNEKANLYTNLSDMYNQLVSQYRLYIGHVVRNVDGVEVSPKSVEQVGDVFTPASIVHQKEAMQFLNDELFDTPAWLLNDSILNKISYPVTNNVVQNIQMSTLSELMNPSLLYRMELIHNRFGNESYSLPDMMNRLMQIIWGEWTTNTYKPLDMYRRNLQKEYVDNLIQLCSVTNTSMINISAISFNFTNTNIQYTDIPSLAKKYLKMIQNIADQYIRMGKPINEIDKIHLLDIQERIKKYFSYK